MLTADLLSYRCRNGAIKPNFLDVSLSPLLSEAEDLLHIYRSGVESRLSREEIGRLLEDLPHPSLPDKAAAGLRRVAEEQSQFTTASPDYDYAGSRRRVFSATEANLAAAKGDFAEYTARREVLAQDLYGDLPELEVLTCAPEFTAKSLMERYNMELASSLLLYAGKMTLEVAADTGAGELRRLFKYLKFFRLAAGITERDGKIILEIDGPAAIFTNTRKYALQLASFFPAVALLKHWSMTADLVIGGRKGTLVLTEKNALVSHYRVFSKYVPEEIRMFHHLFEEKVPEFKVVAGEWLRLDSGEVIFPDLCFEHVSGVRFSLELFHRFHAAMLPRRLAQLDGTANILLGVDRFLAPDEAALGELTRQCPEPLKRKIFLFRDFPGVERVHSLLKKCVGDLQKTV